MKTKFFYLLLLFSAMVNAQNVVFGDPIFKENLLTANTISTPKLKYVGQNDVFIELDSNGDGEIQISEAKSVHKIIFYPGSSYSTLEGINYFENLEYIYYENNTGNSHQHPKFIDININGLNNLKVFNLSDCDIENLSIKNCNNVTQILVAFLDSYNQGTHDIAGNQQKLIVDNCPILTQIISTNNSLKVAEITNCPSLVHLDLHGNALVSFDASPLLNLEILNLSNEINFLEANINEAFHQPSMSNLNINGLSNLKELKIRNQLMSNLDLSQTPLLEILDCEGNKFNNLDISACSNLKYFNCSYNLLTNLDLSNHNFNFINDNFTVDCSFNAIESLQLANAFIKGLDCSHNQLVSLDFSNVVIENLICRNNLLTSLDLSNIPGLKYLLCNNNQLTILDLNKNLALGKTSFNNNPNLTHLFLKNGRTQEISDYVSPTEIYSNDTFENTTIKYICVDDSEIEMLNAVLAHEGVAANVNTYCSFVPGGNYNTIIGKVRYDENNNGCDDNDEFFEHMKIVINDGMSTGTTFVQNNGEYNFYTQSGSFTVNALPENPTLFQATPSSFVVNFPNDMNNVFTQNICVTKTSNKNDLEVVLAPLNNARPGFESQYKLVFRNKGNTNLSGTISFTYDSSKMSFVSSSNAYQSTSGNSIIFNYSNLKPYENKALEITMLINTPTNPTNPVNDGDILNFQVQGEVASDILPNDNSFNFKQMVVNSFDPNDIVCLEGDTVPTTMSGEYFHYIVNFENVGTAEAENIVVEMEIDTTEFEIETLQTQNSSHLVYTRVKGNRVEFIFKKIKLGSGGHGNVLLKIKSIDGKSSGEEVKMRANIFFDYNFPVATNQEITIFQNYLSTTETDNSNIVLFPNPTKDFIKIQNYNNLKRIDIYDITGKILQTIINPSQNEKINIQKLPKGNYYLKLTSENKVSFKKVIKE